MAMADSESLFTAAAVGVIPCNGRMYTLNCSVPCIAASWQISALLADKNKKKIVLLINVSKVDT